MTNTVYFEPCRDDASVSTSSDVSQQFSIVDQERQSVSSSLYSVIRKAINALRFQRLGLIPKVSRSVEIDYETSGLYSSASVSPTRRSAGENFEDPDWVIFSFEELINATNFFNPDTVLGGSVSGRVFKGWIEKNTLTATEPGRGVAVAIKVGNVEGSLSMCGWLTEIEYLGRLYHPNLVRLWGCCLFGQKSFLVYEFMPLESLENHIFRRSSASSSLLSWSLRLKVALGAAKGLAYLHRADINVIHRNVHSSNILLDLEYNAKLSGFGLAEDGPSDGMSHVSAAVTGTYGYAAPEYIATGFLTAKCDVYGFGVVLLELISGRRSIDTNQPSGEHNLVDWAKPYLTSKHKISLVPDRDLHGQYSWECVKKAANLTLRCICNEPELRPNMDEVVTTLEQLEEL